MEREKLRLCGKLFWKFLKIGAFTFGGGYAMIPLIRREIALHEHWLDEGEIDSIYEAIEAGEMYMTDENLWEALGYAYRFEDSVSWQASTVPIIVDPLA